MYLEHFGLRAFPFGTTPDPRFYYPSVKHKEALACLLYAVEQRKGFALITGEVGAGKSMLCRAALERLGEGVQAAVITHPSLDATELCQAVCSELKLPTGGGKIELLGNLRDCLLARRDQGGNVILILDEAQDFSHEVLEEVRLLGNLETTREKLLQIILVGQPELRRMMATRRMRPLDQRVAVRFHLEALSPTEVSAYIDHRLHVAGALDNGIFDADAKLEVFNGSRGVPRLTNIICDDALLSAYVEDERTVTQDTVSRVIAERESYYDTSGEPADEPAAVAAEKTAVSPRAPAAEPAEPRFVVWHGGAPCGSFALGEGAEVVIGRDSSQCDFAVPDGMVSRRHCLIFSRDGEIIVEDVGSTNGTYVNGKRVERCNIERGDVVRVGACVVSSLAGVPSGAQEAETTVESV